MRISLLLLAATLVGGIYYLQINPEIGIRMQQTFSRENLFEPKFLRKEDQEKYQRQKAPLFYPDKHPPKNPA